MAKTKVLYSNNARTVLLSGISSSATSLPVSSTAGFPVFTPGLLSWEEYFDVTLDDGVNVEIVKVQGYNSNTFLNCLRGQEGTTAVAFGPNTKVENRLTAKRIQDFSRSEDKLVDYTTIEQIGSPSLINANSCICMSPDAAGNPIIGIAKGSVWSFINYSKVVVSSAVVPAGATTTSIPLTDHLSYLTKRIPRAYIIQFFGPTLAGKTRFLQVGLSSIFWETPLLSSPVGETYAIYACTTTSLAPTGGNLDNIFYENSNTIKSSYTVVEGVNASSTGPITIASGATVTIESGSSWSIL